MNMKITQEDLCWPHIKIIKNNYNALEVKLAPEEKDRQKTYFLGSQVGLIEKIK
jgi:hypothetical protein